MTDTRTYYFRMSSDLSIPGIMFWNPLFMLMLGFRETNVQQKIAINLDSQRFLVFLVMPDLPSHLSMQMYDSC